MHCQLHFAKLPSANRLHKPVVSHCHYLLVLHVVWSMPSRDTFVLHVWRCSECPNPFLGSGNSERSRIRWTQTPLALGLKTNAHRTSLSVCSRTLVGFYLNVQVLLPKRTHAHKWNDNYYLKKTEWEQVRPRSKFLAKYLCVVEYVVKDLLGR